MLIPTRNWRTAAATEAARPGEPDAVGGNPPRHVGQLAAGAVLDFAVRYQRVAERFGVPRHNH